ncbi:hypothetical protein [Herbaspirillum rubrisubalbicans]|uniref:hypothetical protein n=1 Tax=Herbaspirillum rubrisubalbicans TaxID=80842 RepID=UPI00032697B1|nr:hypothetical protein [Herbaspirillum rubrisubalbicans]
MDFRGISSFEELHQYLGSRGLPGIDSEYSQFMINLKIRFGAKGIHLNRWWVMTGSDWICPACGRSKAEIVRLDQHQYLMGLLHEHHDHMKDLVLKKFLAEAVKRHVVVANALAERFAIRTAFGLSAYDNTVICSDCNHADALAKRVARTHPDFSFSPAEIRKFVEPLPNVGPHAINAETAVQIWKEGQPIFGLRMAMVNRVAKMAASNRHWYQPSDRTAVQTKKYAKSIFSTSGLSDLARRLGAYDGPEMLLYRTNIYRGSNASWRNKKDSKQPTAIKAPTTNDLQLLASRRGKFWNRVGDDWRCPCCERTRFQCVRPSSQSPWIFEVKEKTLFAPDEQRKMAYFTVCEDCSNVARHLAREVLDTAGIDLPDPSVIISLEELSQVIIERPHARHEVNSERIEELFPTFIERIEEFYRSTSTLEENDVRRL